MQEISGLLNTGLDEETLRVCVQLLEAGVNPEALATVVQELWRETKLLKVGAVLLVCMTWWKSSVIGFHCYRTLKRLLGDRLDS